MADEIQKPFLDKVSDGLSNVGTSIADGVSGFLDKSAQGQEFLGQLSDADRAAVAAGDSSPLYKMNNFQNTQSILNAQNPTPLALAEGNTLTPPLENLGAIEPTTLVMDSMALNNKAPLTPEEQGVALQGVQSMEPVPGAGPLPNSPVQSDVPAPQSQIDTQSIVNPMAGSQGLAMKGIQQAQDAGLLKAEAESAYYSKKAQLEEEAQLKQQALEDKFNLEYQSKMDDFTEAIQDFKSLAGQKIVPGAFLARQDTSASLATGIAVALGSLGGMYSGTNQNIGLEMINKAIDKDVEAQKFNLDQAYRIKKASIDDQSNLLSKMRERFGDEKSAILASKLALTSMAHDKMNQELTKKGGSQDLAVNSQANMARSQIKARQEQLEMQLKAAQSEAFAKQQLLAGKDKNNLSPEEAIVAYGPEASKQYVSGFGLARSSEDKKKFQEEYGDSKNSLDALKTIITTDVNKLSPYDRARLGTELSLLTGKMRLAVLGPGAMTEAEYDRLRDALGDPTKIVALPGTQMLKLQTVLKRLQSNQDNLVRMYFGKDKFNELKQNDASSLVKPIK